MVCSSQVVGEREAEVRGSQEQASRLQTELTRLRQELQEKMAPEEQQMADKKEKIKKASMGSKQKLNQLNSKSHS